MLSGVIHWQLPTTEAVMLLTLVVLAVPANIAVATIEMATERTMSLTERFILLPLLFTFALVCGFCCLSYFFT
jgi:DMSO reductase anchor subunit